MLNIAVFTYLFAQNISYVSNCFLPTFTCVLAKKKIVLSFFKLLHTYTHSEVPRKF